MYYSCSTLCTIAIVHACTTDIGSVCAAWIVDACAIAIVGKAGREGQEKMPGGGFEGSPGSRG